VVPDHRHTHSVHGFHRDARQVGTDPAHLLSAIASARSANVLIVNELDDLNGVERLLREIMYHPL
jgi:hypothetical protein